MSNVPKSQVPTIQTRGPVDSLPLRTGLENLRQAINDNNTRIDNTLSPGPSEVTDARDNMTSLKSNINLRAPYGNRVSGFTDLQVVENAGGADNTVQVSVGSGIVNGIGVDITSVQTSAAISASAAGNHRRIVVVVASDNTIAALSGAEVLTSATPPYPAISSAQLPLANFIIDDTASVVINDADITDDRLPAIDPFEGIEYFGSSVTYDSSNNISTRISVDKKGNNITYTYAYTADNEINTITITFSTLTVTYTVTYDSDGNISSQIPVLAV